MEQIIQLGVIDSAQRHERADAAANRRLILDAAQQLFEAHGVAAVNMADIAQAAGVGKGTLYRRFNSKAEICLALMDSQLQAFQNEMLAEMQRMTAVGLARLDQLAFFLDRLVYFTEAHAPLLCEAQRADLLAADGENLQLPHFWQHMTVSALLQTAVAAGELPEGLDVVYLADALLAPLKADLFRFQREARGFTPARISAGLRTLLRGLQK